MPIEIKVLFMFMIVVCVWHMAKPKNKTDKMNERLRRYDK
jgi:hypothetical protein